MRIANCVSYFQVPIVQRLLNSCAVIAVHVENPRLEAIQNMFGFDRVRIVESPIEWVDKQGGVNHVIGIEQILSVLLDGLSAPLSRTSQDIVLTCLVEFGVTVKFNSDVYAWCLNCRYLGSSDSPFVVPELLVRQCRDNLQAELDMKRAELKQAQDDSAQESDPDREYRFRLPNGNVLVIHYGNDSLSIGLDVDPADITAWVCSVTRDGVLAMPNSGDGVELVEGLRPGQPGPQEISDYD